jgi:hypothetical protein
LINPMSSTADNLPKEPDSMSNLTLGDPILNVLGLKYHYPIAYYFRLDLFQYTKAIQNVIFEEGERW